MTTCRKDANVEVHQCTSTEIRAFVERHHYSRRLPPPMVAFRVIEGGQMVGAIAYSRGAAPMIGRPFGVNGREAMELIRIAYSTHDSFVSHAIAVTSRAVRDLYPECRVLVTYADTEQGHEGGVYRAANWIHVGDSITHTFLIGGKRVHPKTLHARYGKGGQSIPWLRANVDPRAARVKLPPKRKFVLPLDAQMRRRVLKMRARYQRDTPGSQLGEARSIRAARFPMARLGVETPST